MTDITHQLGIWIEQVRAIALTGLAFEPQTYDHERYEEMLKLAANMTATLNGQVELDPVMAETLTARWRGEVGNGPAGYVTAKVGVGAIVFNAQDEVLLIRRPEGGWLFPTGWADVGYSPAQVAAKEVREETGLNVTPLKVMGIYDSTGWRHDLNPHFYSVVFYCRLDGGELHPHPLETCGAGFFPCDALPEPLFRTATNWVDQAWRFHKGQTSQAYFDPLPESLMIGLKWFYEFLYRFSKPRWDSGVTPPEVVAEIESGHYAADPGRALDLGCGTGTNSIYLAQHGFRVVAVDFAPRAIEEARAKARQAKVSVDFYINDVTRLDFVREPVDFVLDIGCLHGLNKPDRARYAENLVRLTRPGSRFMLYAFGPHASNWRQIGLSENQVSEAFSPQFIIRRIERGSDHGRMMSAWYWLERCGTQVVDTQRDPQAPIKK